MNKLSLGDALFETLNAPAYSLAEASRLTGLSVWRVSSYLRGYKKNYEYGGKERKLSKPGVVDQSLSASTYASFLDLVDLLVIHELRKRKFSLQFLRNALEEAKEILGTPHFARSTFYTHSDEIILELPKKGYMIKLMSGRQSVMPPIVEGLSSRLEFEDLTEFGFAKKFFPLGKNHPVVVDPQISFGRPTIVGWGVPTNNIYDLYLGESQKLEPVVNWFEIPSTQVEAAVQFERTLWG